MVAPPCGVEEPGVVPLERDPRHQRTLDDIIEPSR